MEDIELVTVRVSKHKTVIPLSKFRWLRNDGPAGFAYFFFPLIHLFLRVGSKGEYDFIAGLCVNDSPHHSRFKDIFQEKMYDKIIVAEEKAGQLAGGSVVFKAEALIKGGGPFQVLYAEIGPDLFCFHRERVLWSVSKVAHNPLNKGADSEIFRGCFRRGMY